MNNKYLLDTCVLFDCLFRFCEMDKRVIELLSNDNAKIAISVASIWEVTIKHLKHPKEMPVDGDGLVDILRDLNLEIIPIKEVHARMVTRTMLEGIHNDLFDHMIITTAAVEGYTLVTKDEAITKYNCVRTLKI